MGKIDWFDFDIKRAPDPRDENQVKFCKICGCIEFEDSPSDYFNGHVCEKEILCKDCGHVVNYWAYGHYENYDAIDNDEYRQMLRQKKIERIMKCM